MSSRHLWWGAPAFTFWDHWLEPGKMNVASKPLVDPQKILLPTLHVKLGIAKNFAKAMNKNGEGFRFLKRKFPKLSEAKIKKRIFQRPKIRQLMLNCDFEKTLTDLKRQTY